jgi:hypothetical protein
MNDRELDKYEKQMALASKTVLQELARIHSYNITAADRSGLETRVKKAIEDDSSLAVMLECIKEQTGLCNSVFCMECRKKKQNALYKQFAEYYNDAFGGNEELVGNRFRYVTILHDLREINCSDPFHEADIIRKVRASVSNFKARLAEFGKTSKSCKGKSGKIWLRGSIHIEMLSMELRKISEFSDKLTASDEASSNFEKVVGYGIEYWFLVHGHFLLDIDCYTESEIRKMLRLTWNASGKQINVSRLTTFHEGPEKKLELHSVLRNIADHGYNGSNSNLKFASAHDSANINKDRKYGAIGLSMTDTQTMQSTNVDEYLSYEQLRLLIKVHNIFTDGGQKGLTISIG